VILAGPAGDRARLKARIGDSCIVVGEFATEAEARTSALSADAIMRAVVPQRSRVIHSDDAALAEALTAREIEVLELLATGSPNKKIAARLGISDQTVKFHVASICGKLGAHNRTEAVRLGFRRGLISL
jgi:DNA-binding NarL/FixJ family response regulator